MKIRCLRWLAVLVLIVWPGIGSAQQTKVPQEVWQKTQSDGVVRVFVQLNVPWKPTGTLSQEARRTQEVSILLAELAGTRHRVTAPSDGSVAALALEVGPDALAVLERSALVIGVTGVRLLKPHLSESAPLVQADQAWAAGFDGTGWAVAILDTGVDEAHPFLAGKVVGEACFSSNSNCPNGETIQIGPGAGVPCTYATQGCKHGTHVAGIAAGTGETFSGVAKGASIIAIQVFSRFTGDPCVGQGEDPCALSSEDDLFRGLLYVRLLAAASQIASVNMSLGGGVFSNPKLCDAVNAGMKAAIDNLRSERIAAVIASGNDGATTGISWPACISTAVSVGATTKTDQISDFSNSASFLSLLAPGSGINSSIPGSGFEIQSGTSQAAPHVAGAWAVLKQAYPTMSMAICSTPIPLSHQEIEPARRSQLKT